MLTIRGRTAKKTTRGGKPARSRSAIRKPRVSEHQEQAAFFNAARTTYGFSGEFDEDLLFSVPNGMWAGGKNPYALINKFKREGLKPGVSDILYLQPRGGFSYLAIEMKAQDRRGEKNAVTPEQMKFLKAVERAGGWGVVCYGCEEALKVFGDYMGLPLNRRRRDQRRRGDIR